MTWLPSTRSVKLPAVAVPPLSLATILLTVSTGSLVSVKVQETVSPGARLMVAVAVPRLVVVPPDGSLQTRLVSAQPPGGPISRQV